MSKLSKTIAGGSFAFALTLMAGGAAAQETPVPVPVPDPAEEQIEVPVEAQADPATPIVVELAAVGGAEGSGEATLSTSMGDQTQAVVEVEGLAPAQYSAFLIGGTCDQPGEVVAPLGTVEVSDQGSGRGEVALTTAIAELTAADATVQLHPQGEEPSQALLCGAVAAEAAAADAAAPAF